MTIIYKSKTRFQKFCLLALSSAFLLIPSIPASAGTTLPNRYDKLSDSRASEVATHEIGFLLSDTASPVGSVSLTFCSNTPVAQDVCTFPTGFDASATGLDSQVGETGFSIDPSSTANKIILTRAAVVPSGVQGVYTFSNITNPSDRGSFYLRIESFASNDASGQNIQEGGVALAINNPIEIGAEVPPFIIFCVGVTITAFDCSSADTYFIDFGIFRTTSTSTRTSQFIAATNAEHGYSVTIAGTTLTSGLNTIPAMNVPAVATTGISQFGFNLRQNTVPSNGNEVTGPGTALPTANYSSQDQYKFTNGDIIASVDHSDDIRKYTANYIVNVSSAQPGGVYATTLLFICLANF